jgi:hypothetical protein
MAINISLKGKTICFSTGGTRINVLILQVEIPLQHET